MQLSPGNIVRSTAGRDKDRLYLVVAVTANRVRWPTGEAHHTAQTQKQSACNWLAKHKLRPQ